MAKKLGRFRCTDMVRDWRGRDQEEQPDGPEGELLCRLMEGRDGNWAGHDVKGRVLHVRRAKDGALEVRSVQTAGDDANPDITGTYPAGAGGGDPARAAGSTGDALSRYLGHPQWEGHIPALAAYQKRLNDYYGG